MWDHKEILIIGAHFDDHILGCGGLIAHLNDLKKYIMNPSYQKIILTDYLEPGKFNVNSYSKIIDYLQPYIDRAEIIFTHFPYDLNTDHLITTKATLAACRRSKATILFYEVLSSTERGIEGFKPNLYVPLDQVIIRKKCAAFEEFKGASNHIRNVANITTWAQMRGIECGYNYAEAFILHRQIL